MVEKSIKKKEKQEMKITSKNAIKHGMIGATQGFAAFGKKGNFNAMSGIAKSLVIFGIVIGMGLLILSKFQDTTTNGSVAHEEIGNVMGLFSDLTTWGAILLIVAIAYLIMRYLGAFASE